MKREIRGLGTLRILFEEMYGEGSVYEIPTQVFDAKLAEFGISTADSESDVLSCISGNEEAFREIGKKITGVDYIISYL